MEHWTSCPSPGAGNPRFIQNQENSPFRQLRSRLRLQWFSHRPSHSSQANALLPFLQVLSSFLILPSLTRSSRIANIPSKSLNSPIQHCILQASQIQMNSNIRVIKQRLWGKTRWPSCEQEWKWKGGVIQVIIPLLYENYNIIFILNPEGQFPINSSYQVNVIQLPLVHLKLQTFPSGAQ